jgi:fibronectin type 3 domain-containing protein
MATPDKSDSIAGVLDYDEVMTIYFTDYGVEEHNRGDEFYYKIYAVDNDGNESALSNMIEYEEGRYAKPIAPELVGSSIPTAFAITSHPNPFNPVTKITYDVPNESQVMITVFNILGQEVTELTHKMHNPGSYSVNFDASNLSAGVYIVHMTAFDDKGGLVVKDQKITLLK